jgi:hypothetical protein
MPQIQTEKDSNPLSFGNMEFNPETVRTLEVVGFSQIVNPAYKHVFTFEELMNSTGPVKYFGPKLTEEEVDQLCKKYEHITEEFLESLGYKRVVSISAPREVKIQPLHPHISNTPFL